MPAMFTPAQVGCCVVVTSSFKGPEPEIHTSQRPPLSLPHPFRTKDERNKQTSKLNLSLFKIKLPPPTIIGLQGRQMKMQFWNLESERAQSLFLTGCFFKPLRQNTVEMFYFCYLRVPVLLLSVWAIGQLKTSNKSCVLRCGLGQQISAKFSFFLVKELIPRTDRFRKASDRAVLSSCFDINVFKEGTSAAANRRSGDFKVHIRSL